MTALLVITSCIFTSCGESSSSSSSSNFSNDLILPGKDRVWWYEGFDSCEEIEKFILTLRKANMNGNFRFGFSDVEAPNGYKHFYTSFSGHIDIDSSNKEDIYYSKYDRFWIETYFNENTNVLPIYNSFVIYFYPFYSNNENFSNDAIEHTIIDYYDGSAYISFNYDESVIMEVKLEAASKGKINKEQLIDALIDNYKVII